ncbi:GNAT family N-acetyltransferase [Streptomyces sp. NPDC091281]|uniref:GNAT family N-acetyltransferase n=1 Tax=Streptomyces sp. NPDC091281 TaxID=3365985 RepID=UPI00381F56D5
MTSMHSVSSAADAIRPTISVKPGPYDHPDARHLVRALRQEQIDLYGFADEPDTTPADDFAAPGRFLIARLGREPVGCAGVRFLDARTAEIKKMYVALRVRRFRLGHTLLELLETHAARHGATRILLETGHRNTAALALYESAGYVPRESYIPGRDRNVNRAMTKTLGAPS